MKRIFLSSLIVVLLGCRGGAPAAPQNVKYYVGSNELQGVIGKPELCPGVVTNVDGIDVCLIEVRDPVFRDLVCVSSSDEQRIQDYIIELNTKCRKWRD